MVLAVNLIKTNMIMLLMVRVPLSLMVDKAPPRRTINKKSLKSLKSKPISEGTWLAELLKLNTDFRLLMANSMRTAMVLTMATTSNKSKLNKSSVRFSNNSVTSTTSPSQWVSTSLNSNGRKRCN